jgi:acylphosphatase
LNFRGEVQGVGFRVIAARLARGFPVTGWVRNDGDGSVTLEVQGELEALQRFLASLRASRVGSGILDEQQQPAPLSVDDKSFEIRYW